MTKDVKKLRSSLVNVLTVCYGSGKCGQQCTVNGVTHWWEMKAYKAEHFSQHTHMQIDVHVHTNTNTLIHTHFRKLCSHHCQHGLGSSVTHM